jgi:hypothetical protein
MAHAVLSVATVQTVVRLGRCQQTACRGAPAATSDPKQRAKAALIRVIKTMYFTMGRNRTRRQKVDASPSRRSSARPAALALRLLAR